jgi:hypothetical protein
MAIQLVSPASGIFIGLLNTIYSWLRGSIGDRLSGLGVVMRPFAAI